jgi:Na+/melibiose symporter-like transporter
MKRTLPLVALMVLLFAGTVAVLVNVMPGPHKSTDYLVMGAVATLLCLLLLFVVFIKLPQRRKP